MEPHEIRPAPTTLRDLWGTVPRGWRFVLIGLASVAVCVTVLRAINPPPPDPFSLTCAELDTEMAKMTGPTATLADYDALRVRAINRARDARGCY